MTDVFPCPCVFVSDSPSCARYRIVLRQDGICISQPFEDIFKTLKILQEASQLKLPCSAVGRAANYWLLFSWS